MIVGQLVAEPPAEVVGFVAVVAVEVVHVAVVAVVESEVAAVPAAVEGLAVVGWVGRLSRQWTWEEERGCQNRPFLTRRKQINTEQRCNNCYQVSLSDTAA